MLLYATSATHYLHVTKASVHFDRQVPGCLESIPSGNVGHVNGKPTISFDDFPVRSANLWVFCSFRRDDSIIMWVGCDVTLSNKWDPTKCHGDHFPYLNFHELDVNPLSFAQTQHPLRLD